MAQAASDPVRTTEQRSFLGLPRNVTALGITSFLADVSSEMIYPLIPIFLTATLGAPVAIVGLIEGIAESTASLLKLASGWFSDHVRRRLPLVVSGYALAALGKLLLALAAAWPIVMFARFIDRFGKGIRGTPRDALIADSTPPDVRGRAYGLHRSMDTAGAVIGPLLGLGLVALLNDDMRLVFLLAVVPGTLAVVSLALVKEPVLPTREASPAVPGRHTGIVARVGSLDGRLKLFLLASVVFALGNSSDIFLILRAKDLGLSTTATVFAYVIYNCVYMASALPAGIVSDRIGRRAVLITGLAIFAAVYAGFALTDRPVHVWPLFAAYGLYIAMTDGVGKALITDLAPGSSRATVLGAYGMITGLATLLASALAGLLWDLVAPWAPFALGAMGAAAGALMLALIRTNPRPEVARGAA
jgi:MFS family permease